MTPPLPIDAPRPRPLAVVGPLAAAALLAAAGCAGPRWTPPADDPVANAEAQRAAQRRADELAYSAQEAEKQGRLTEAAALYREAVSLNNASAAAWHNLGHVLLQQGDALEAASAFKTAADLWPQDPRPVFNIGVVWEQRGYADEAMRYYDEALLRDENYLPALRRAIYLDQIRVRWTDNTERRLKRALLLETDPVWREYFQRQQIRSRGADRPVQLSSGGPPAIDR